MYPHLPICDICYYVLNTQDHIILAFYCLCMFDLTFLYVQQKESQIIKCEWQGVRNEGRRPGGKKELTWTWGLAAWVSCPQKLHRLEEEKLFFVLCKLGFQFRQVEYNVPLGLPDSPVRQASGMSRLEA